MNALAFDNEKYLLLQSQHIRQRLDAFGGKLYLEFGGKLFDDNHAAYFEDIKSHQTKLRSSKFAKLKATVNNKKLHFVSSDNGKMFDIAKGNTCHHFSPEIRQ